MPGFDHKGPQGQGPMTGRRMGRCTNYGLNIKVKEGTVDPEQDNNITGNYPGSGKGMGPGRRGFPRGRGKGLRPGRQNRFQSGF
jgi:hypothetical protein